MKILRYRNWLVSRVVKFAIVLFAEGIEQSVGCRAFFRNRAITEEVDVAADRISKFLRVRAEAHGPSLKGALRDLLVEENEAAPVARVALDCFKQSPKDCRVAFEDLNEGAVAVNEHA